MNETMTRGDEERELDPALTGDTETPEADEVDPLEVSLTLRIPIWRRNSPDTPSAREKLEMLEEYMLLSAFTRGNLAAERNKVREEMDDLLENQAVVSDLEYSTGKKLRTGPQIRAARHENDPDRYEKIAKLESREKRLSEEMERLDQDAKLCSRAYSPYLSG